MGDKERIAELEAQLAALAGEVEAYRGALGYAVPGDCDGRLSDGTFPNNGIAEAVCKERDTLLAGFLGNPPKYVMWHEFESMRAEVAKWSKEALAWRNGCTGRHGSKMACVNVAALADKQGES